MKRLVDTYHPETIVSGKRTIRDGSRFNPYFPPPDERDRVIIQDGEVTDTVELMIGYAKIGTTPQPAISWA